MQPPYRTEHEALSHEVFTALMWAFSYPGEKQKTQHANLKAIAETLLDLETSFYAADDEMRKACQRTGSKAKPLKQADYLFFSSLDDTVLASLKDAKRGNLLYPDHAATLILTCQFDEGQGLELAGPGIKTQLRLKTSLPREFWQMRNEICSYPLGWDLFLCDGHRVVGIPRTTEVKL